MAITKIHKIKTGISSELSKGAKKIASEVQEQITHTAQDATKIGQDAQTSYGKALINSVIKLGDDLKFKLSSDPEIAKLEKSFIAKLQKEYDAYGLVSRVQAEELAKHNFNYFNKENKNIFAMQLDLFDDIRNRMWGREFSSWIGIWGSFSKDENIAKKQYEVLKNILSKDRFNFSDFPDMRRFVKAEARQGSYYLDIHEISWVLDSISHNPNDYEAGKFIGEEIKYLVKEFKSRSNFLIDEFDPFIKSLLEDNPKDVQRIMEQAETLHGTWQKKIISIKDLYKKLQIEQLKQKFYEKDKQEMKEFILRDKF